MPANLNPKHSGSTLAKIMEGKYVLPSMCYPEQVEEQATIEMREPSRERSSELSIRIKNKIIQETNLSGKIQDDPSQVNKISAVDSSVVH